MATDKDVSTWAIRAHLQEDVFEGGSDPLVAAKGHRVVDQQRKELCARRDGVENLIRTSGGAPSRLSERTHGRALNSASSASGKAGPSGSRTTVSEAWSARSASRGEVFSRRPL